VNEPHILSVNVGAIREVEWRDELVTTAIWKSPVNGRVALRGVNFVGDDQADRSVHGGVDKAVYAYSREDYDYWRSAGQSDAGPALFGENLTTEGIDLSAVVAGEQWSVGSAILEAAQPRLPCFKLGIRVGDSHFPRRFLAALRMGAYFRVVREGDVAAGDVIRVSNRPAHGVTLRDMAASLQDHGKAAALLQISKLPAFWRHVATRA
jgi:MOSC domain-containing protein YiiM